MSKVREKNNARRYIRYMGSYPKMTQKHRTSDIEHGTCSVEKIEGTLEIFPFPMSLQDIVSQHGKPATMWRANFLCRSATAGPR